MIGATYDKLGNFESCNRSMLSFKPLLMSFSKESSLPIQDKQEITCRSQKDKETELELSQNETAK